jgi:hypothetical protein
MQIAERKKGLEAVSGRSFRKLIEKHAINALFVKKDGAEVLADQEEFILNLSAYRSILAEDRGNRREIRLIDDVINRKTRRSVLNLLRFYSHSIADDYNSINVQPLHASGRSLQILQRIFLQAYEKHSGGGSDSAAPLQLFGQYNIPAGEQDHI